MSFGRKIVSSSSKGAIDGLLAEFWCQLSRLEAFHNGHPFNISDGICNSRYRTSSQKADRRDAEHLCSGLSLTSSFARPAF